MVSVVPSSLRNLAEVGKVISPEPKLAQILHKRDPLILPEETYHWIVDWIEDVGSVMRSREYKVSFMANALTYFTLSRMFKPFPMISEVLGLR